MKWATRYRTAVWTSLQPQPARQNLAPFAYPSHSPHLNQPSHITTAFRAETMQYQVATLDCPGEVTDSDLMSALNAPDVGQQ